MNRRRFLASTLSFAGIGSLGRSFSWDAFGASRESLRVAFFTDFHCAVQAGVPEAVLAAAKAIRRGAADLHIGGGDFITEGVHSCPAETLPRWQLYRRFQNELGVPVEPTIGNHDLVAVQPPGACNRAMVPQQEFLEFFGLERTYRTFVANGYRFFILDSLHLTKDVSAGPYVGRISAEQIDWLKGELEQVGPNVPVVVVSHIPLRTNYFRDFESPGYTIPQNLLVQNADEVLALFSKKNLVTVLQGHLHVNECFRVRNTTFVTGGAICGGWWHGAWHGTQRGFGILTLRASRAEWEYLSYDSVKTP